MATMDPLGALSSLGDATRRRIYDLVPAQTAPVSRDEVAAAAGVGRTLAAYHLDRLAAEGLLVVTQERRTGRSGPGAGRPAKLYARSQDEVSVSVPPRDYHLAARLLADAAAADTDGHTRRALTAAAQQLGRELAADDAAVGAAPARARLRAVRRRAASYGCATVPSMRSPSATRRSCAT